MYQTEAPETYRRDWRTALPFALVVGGAIGNVIDRQVHGHVVDFIQWYVGSYTWPSFNIADSAIVVGAIGIALFGLFDGKSTVTFDESRENDAAYVKWWRGLIAQGWRGRPGDGAERLYAPAAASAAASAVRGARVASSRSSSHRGPSLTSQDLEAMGRAAGRAMASQVVPGVSSAIRDRARDERQHAHASSFTGGR